jgi:hypothetical protein
MNSISVETHRFVVDHNVMLMMKVEELRAEVASLELENEGYVAAFDTQHDEMKKLFEERDGKQWYPMQGTPEWVSVEDRLPETGVGVILYSETYDVAIGRLDWVRSNGKPIWMDGDWEVTKVAYWQPMPEEGPNDGTSDTAG